MCTVAADWMDDQNLVLSLGKVLLSPPRPHGLGVPTCSAYRTGSGGIEQPERDTDMLWEMKIREDIPPYCQTISRYSP